jgi:hypothetical protein
MEVWFVAGLGVLKARTSDGSCLEISISEQETSITSPSNKYIMSPNPKNDPRRTNAGKAAQTPAPVPADFMVRLDGIKLTSEGKERIEKGIQRLVLSELADHMHVPGYPPFLPTPRTGGAIISIPIKWPGYWLRVLSADEFDDIQQTLSISEQIDDAKPLRDE